MLVVDDEQDAPGADPADTGAVQRAGDDGGECGGGVGAGAERAAGLDLERYRDAGEDGYGLLRRVRALSHEDGGDTAAVAITAFARSEDRRRALLAGFQMHLPKPIEPAELIAIVESNFEKSRGSGRGGSCEGGTVKWLSGWGRRGGGFGGGLAVALFLIAGDVADEFDEVVRGRGRRGRGG